MQRVVNGLWASGAEAITVNGQRLTALSAIRAAGDAILVDNKPLVPPYTVLAIGDGKRLSTAFQSSADGQYLRVLQDDYGIRASVSVQGTLRLAAAPSLIVRYAKPDTARRTPPGPTRPRTGRVRSDRRTGPRRGGRGRARGAAGGALGRRAVSADRRGGRARRGLRRPAGHAGRDLRRQGLRRLLPVQRGGGRADRLPRRQARAWAPSCRPVSWWSSASGSSPTRPPSAATSSGRDRG